MPSKKLLHGIVPALALAGLLMAACAPAAAPSPTAAPAKPAPTTAPAKPAPTAAPAKPAPEKPAATQAPAPKPTEPPVARPAFDEQAVAEFYKGKTVRIIVGAGPGGSFDIYARMVAKQLPRYIPGNPTVIVENQPGAVSILAANAVYNTERKDGTVIGYVVENFILQQVIGAPGVQFDAGKFQYLSSTVRTAGACQTRTDTGIKSIQEVLEGKQLIVGSTGPGSLTNDVPAALKAALGANIKIVPGYDGTAKMRLALEAKEVDGLCSTFDEMVVFDREKLEGSNPSRKVLVIMGAETPNHPYLKGVPAVETLARTDEARQLLRLVHAPAEMTKPWVVAPEVPKERVEALRKAVLGTLADKEFLADADKGGWTVSPRSGEEVAQIARSVLSTPPATIEKLKAILK
ncbi:MAG: hypothetical protein HY690_16550 [Chloroflexi bacterium]|nr:hypothetical protein [Chloroflexota bacterium]